MTQLQKNPTPLEQITKNKTLRREAARRSHLFFFHAFLGHHIKYKTAPFQKELFALTQDQSKKYLVVEAARGSAKSTLIALSLPIWSIIGVQKKKFVLIFCKTQQQARQTMKNIMDELTDNELLKAELGPFQELRDEWRAQSIVIPKYEARITVVSLETSIRGIKHGAHRPDLIICDDLEDLASVKSKDMRDKLYTQFGGDMVPLGDLGTQIVVIGTRLHNDSLLMRLRQDIAAGMSGTFRSYPLVDDEGRISWPAKFPNMEAIDALRRTVPTIQAWSREYLLRIIDDEETIVKRAWIKKYKEMPSKADNPDYCGTLTGVDLAITVDTKADCTAAVTMSLFRSRDGVWKAYVHPFPLNDRLEYPATRDILKRISKVSGDGNSTPLHIESVQYQKAMVQDLRHDGFPAEEFKVHGQDKAQRLTIITHLIEQGIILFPEEEAEELIQQLVNFGAERHDDLADAFAIAAHVVMSRITEPGYVIPSQQSSQSETGHEEELLQNDLWFEDIKLGFQQGRIPAPQYYAACDTHRERKIEINTRKARAQWAKEAEEEKERMEIYQKQVYRQLMRPRMYG